MDASGINSAFTLVTSVLALGKRATNLQYEEALVAAREALIKLREDNVEIRERNHNLQTQISELEKLQDLSEKIEYAADAYWRKMTDSEWQGPLCAACWIDRRKAVPLARMRMASVYWVCPSCKAQYSYNIPEKHPDDPKSFKPRTPEVIG